MTGHQAMLSLPRHSLIVSCQPVPGGPLDRTDIVVAFALAALASGAHGLRIEGVERVAAVCAATAAPVIGIVKRDLPGTPVRITPFVEDIGALAQAGAHIIAFDATDCPHPISPAALCEAIHDAGRLAMADISNASEARKAVDFGADMIGTTLSGYTGGAVPDGPDLALIREISGLGKPVIAEGRVRMPQQARKAIDLGAYAVVVGSAITRPEHITGWFAEAVADVHALQDKQAAAV